MDLQEHVAVSFVQHVGVGVYQQERQQIEIGKQVAIAKRQHEPQPQPVPQSQQVDQRQQVAQC